MGDAEPTPLSLPDKAMQALLLISTDNTGRPTGGATGNILSYTNGYIHSQWCQIGSGAFLLTWINFNPNMDK